jgi:hypothetical protein
MILRLPADADLNGAIVSGVDVPLERLPDHVVLAIAAEDRRVLVTHDVSSMPRSLPRVRSRLRQSRNHLDSADIEYW